MNALGLGLQAPALPATEPSQPPARGSPNPTELGVRKTTLRVKSG